MACLGLATSAHADRRVFTWNYEPIQFPPQFAELEFYHQARFLNLDDMAAVRGVLQLEFEYNPTNWYNIGIYSVFSAGQETVFDSLGKSSIDRNFTWEGVKFRQNFTLADAQLDPIGFGLYIEPILFMNSFALEGRIIVGKIWRRFHLVTNVILEWETSFQEFAHRFSVKPYVGFGYEFSSAFFLGIEATPRFDYVVGGSPQFPVSSQRFRLYIGPSVNIMTPSGIWFSANVSIESTGQWNESMLPNGTLLPALEILQARLIVATPLSGGA